MSEVLLYISIIIGIVGMGLQWIRFRQTGRLLKIQRPIKFSSMSLNLVNGVLNSIFQIKLFKAGKIRWLFHFFVLSGFLYLVFVHALHKFTAPIFFDYYDPTVDPYQFLRNLSGTLVVVGCLGFLLRRGFNTRINPDKKIKQDKNLQYKGCFSIFLILLVVGTGFLLEASKIISEPIFMDMVESYSDLDENPELEDLKLFWQKNYVVHFTKKPDNSVEKLENGQLLNEEYCASCHSDIRSAFVSNHIAKLAYHIGQFLNQNRADSTLYAIHYGVCLVLILSFPFLRLYHMVLIPLVSGKKNQDKKRHLGKTAFIHSADLWACTNCGYCSQVCSVFPNFQITQNSNVLPHIKIESIKTISKGCPDSFLQLLQKGNEACTLCNKCTQICPSGIDLQTLWSKLDGALLDIKVEDNHHFFNQTFLSEWVGQDFMPEPLNRTSELTSNLVEKIDAFENCIQCTICTNVCPVVEYDSHDNDYTPQQVMNLLRLDQKHLAAGTRMVWTCLTCYACQEICPQQIRVTDILLELRQTGGVKADMIKQNSYEKKG